MIPTGECISLQVQDMSNYSCISVYDVQGVYSMGKVGLSTADCWTKDIKYLPSFHEPHCDVCANSIFITAVSRVQSWGRGVGELNMVKFELVKRHKVWLNVGIGVGEQLKVVVHEARSCRRRVCITVVILFHTRSLLERGDSNSNSHSLLLSVEELLVLLLGLLEGLLEEVGVYRQVSHK